MRRGLICWSHAELPEAVFDARLARTHAALEAARLDALVLYANITRPAGASWLTGFVPYWSEGLVVLPRGGLPSLVVSVSPRGEGWVRRTSRVDRVTCTPRVGAEAAKMIRDAKPGARVGVGDLANLPTRLAGGFEGLQLVDASTLVHGLRASSDAAEIALAAKAGTIARRALAAVSTDGRSAADEVAAVDGLARRLGAEEVYVAIAPDLHRGRRLLRLERAAELGDAYAFRATVAYKGAWVRMIRTVVRGEPHPERVAAASRTLAEAVAALPSRRGFERADAWLVEGCRISQPLEPLIGSQLTDAVVPGPGAVVSVSLALAGDGFPVLVGAPALTGGEPAGAGALLVPPVFDAAADPLPG